MSTKLRALKVTETEDAAIEELVATGYYRSVSHVLRAALVLLFQQHRLQPLTAGKIKIERCRHPMRKKKRPPPPPVAGPVDDPLFEHGEEGR